MPTVRASTAPSATLSPTSPASTQVGDLVIVVTATVAAAGVPTHTVQTGDGFTEIRSHSHDDGSTDGRVSIACKVAASSGANTYTAYSVSGGTSNHSLIIVITAGTYDTTLANILSNSITATGTGPPDPPALQPTRSQSLFLIGGFWHYGVTSTATTITEPSGYTTVTSYAASAVCELCVSQRTAAPTSGVSENPAAYADSATPNGTVAFSLVIYGQAISMPTTVASFALTGTAAELTAARTLAAAAGSFALTGVSAVVGRTLSMAAATGVLTLAGTSTGLKADRLLGSTVGTFSLDGPAVGLSAARLVSATVGSFTLSGQDATLTYTPLVGETMDADSGAFSHTGNAATLTAGRKLTASAASFVQTGTATGLLVGRKLTGDTRAFALTGTASSLARGFVLVASTGTHALTGTAVGLTATRLLSAGVGGFALTGQPATVGAGRLLGVTPGAFALAGSDITFASGKGMTADGGVFALTGNTIAFLSTRVLTASVGTFVLDGSAVVVGRNLFFSLDTVAFALEPGVADFALHRRLSGQVGTFVLDGNSAVLISADAILPIVQIELGGGIQEVAMSATVERPSLVQVTITSTHKGGTAVRVTGGSEIE